MKIAVAFVFGLILTSSVAFAWDRNNGNYTQDAYGHSTRNDNLYKDSDGDGVVNYYDRSDRNSSKW